MKHDPSPIYRKLDCNAKCPFYKGVKLAGRGEVSGIECESLQDSKHLGFDLRTFLSLPSQSAMMDYHAIFCADLYESCPYYTALMATKYKDV